MQKKGKPESISDPNPKQASQLNTFNTKFRSRDINHTFLIGTFCPGHLRALKTTYLVLDGPWMSGVAHYNIPQEIHKTLYEPKPPKVYNGRWSKV